MLDELNQSNHFPCPVCADACRVTPTKKQKPCFHCDACGVQVFIRGVDGVKLFTELMNNKEIRKLNSRDPVINLKINKINSKTQLIKSQIIKLEQKDLFFKSGDTKNKISELNLQLTELEHEAQQLLTE